VSKVHRQGNNQKPFLRTKNISWGQIDLTELDHMNFTNAEEVYLKLQAGDLLLCEGGDVGRSAIWNNQMEGCYYQNHLHRLRAKAVYEVVPQFALYWFWYSFEVSDLYIGRSNVTTIPNLSQSKLSELQIPKPEFNEQQHIAHILATVQNSIEQQKKFISLTRELKSALMYKLFTEGLHGEQQKKTEMGLVPTSWEQLRLEKAGDVIYGIQAAVANNLQPIGMKILTNKNITLDGQIVLDEINYFELKTKRHFETVLKKGDILFNWRSGSKEHVGKTAYFNLDGDYTHSSFILRIRPKENVNGRFLFWYLYFLRASGYFLQKHDVSSVNATFNKSAVDALSIIVPSKDEQEEIASILDTVDTKIALLKKKLVVQEELFRTLLHQLMTGQTRVNEIDLPGLL
jgi:type I restriction enzyme S subunit